ncbi:ParB N-terminal domain-containing protein [Acetobacter sp. LMG 32666]|uniref:ParB N-terminal domain-containing protein n=1 Tax=Acetobacter sp. LMG 32666 TaxID=2959295 RepID=UPI0030C83982
MLIALDDIQENGNMRRTSLCATADAALEASIAALGVLQPILVRPDPNGGYVLIAGYRRVAAARRIGLAEVPAEIRLMGELESKAAQAAENVVRLPTDPVDVWRHIDEMIQGGYSLQSAGASLGMPDRYIQQISILSQIAPRLLDAMAGKQLPPWRTLGIIAQAPHDQQIAAFERHNYPHGVTWASVSAECTAHRIPQDRAIFDVAESGVHFEEDLFAEPGSPEQFTTGDIAGFMAAQLAAVQDRIQNGDEPAMLLEYSSMAQLPKLPTGWVYVERKEPLTPRSKHKRAYAIVPANDWMDAGRVVDVVIKPATTTKATTAPATTHSTDAIEQEDYEPELPAEEPEALPDDVCQITKAGYDMLADTQGERQGKN